MIPVKYAVGVRARFGADGTLTPLTIRWPDGRAFEIDRVLEVRNAASAAGGSGRRYRVRILGQERYLFYAPSYAPGGRLGWFVESRRLPGGADE